MDPGSERRPEWSKLLGNMIHVTMSQFTCIQPSTSMEHTIGPDLGVWGVPAICLVLWALCNVDSFTGASFNPALAIGSTFFQSWLFSVNP